ncbi:MAG: two-component system sensor histidine kinase NtrB, partial [Syntrophobacteraceae bacterium]
CIVDQAGKILDVNDSYCAMSGYSREELRGMTVFELEAVEKIEEVEERIRKILEGEATRFETVHFRKDGTSLYVEIGAQRLPGSENHIFAFMRNISDRKKAEQERERLQEQLNQAQKLEAVGRLAGGVAHDFNNMLGVILGHAEMVLDEMGADTPLRHNLLEMKRAAERSADLTRQLLAFARKQTISPKVLDLNETVSAILKMLRRLIGEDISLVWKPGVGIWPVKLDPSQIDQILANLAVNARDAMTGIGSLTIETANAVFDETWRAGHIGFVCGSYVMLAVSDTGTGIDKENLGLIFEPFFTTKEIGKGTGLGLATVYGIVKQNNGFINVYSEPGHGTTFKIYLPRTEEPAAEKAATASKRDLKGTETVLLVEDEETMLE